MERKNIPQKEAEHILKSDDEQRHKWSKHLYGIDTADPTLYDLVLHIKDLTTDDAVDIICHAVGLPNFQITAESQQALEDLLLACEVKVALLDIKPDINVSAQDGVVYVKTKAQVTRKSDLAQEMEKIVKKIPGVKEVDVQVLLYGVWGSVIMSDLTIKLEIPEMHLLLRIWVKYDIDPRLL